MYTFKYISFQACFSCAYKMSLKATYGMITFWKRKNYGDNNRISGFQRLREKDGGMNRAQRSQSTENFRE